MTSMDLGFLPMIKCSNCGRNVEISSMGDHVCAPVDQKSPATAPSSSSLSSRETSNATSNATTPPSPPPSAGLDAPHHLKVALSSRSSRSGAPPRIDPSIANRAFLQPALITPGSSTELHLQSPSSVHAAPRSPMSQPAQLNTRSSPKDESVLDRDTVFSFPMPGSRPPALVGTPSLKMELSLQSSTRFASAPSPRPGLNTVPENIQLPPSPLPPRVEMAHTVHNGRESIVSQSSYRSSLASTRHEGSTTRSSISRSSTQSISRGLRSFMDTPPLPPAPLRTPNQASCTRESTPDLTLTPSARPERGNSYSGFDFGIDSGAAQSSAHSSPQNDSAWPHSMDHDHQPKSLSSYNGAEHLHPADAKADGDDYATRKASDATSESATSITNFARALGFSKQQDDMQDESTASEYESSGARTGSSSGSSMSSLPSDSSLGRDKTPDPFNLGCLVEELPAQTRQTIVEMPDRPRNTLDEIPRIPAVFFSPDSPTDPAIGQGSLSLIAEKGEGSVWLKQQEQEYLGEPPSPSALHAPPFPPPSQTTESPRTSPLADSSLPSEEKPTTPQQQLHAPTPYSRPIQRSSTEPMTRPSSRPGARPKGNCKGCGEPITGKSISSSDGRLTGRYHRGCFVCFDCHSPFPSADFYVLDNRPYCAQHYHERNGSLSAPNDGDSTLSVFNAEPAVSCSRATISNGTATCSANKTLDAPPMPTIVPHPDIQYRLDHQKLDPLGLPAHYDPQDPLVPVAIVDHPAALRLLHLFKGVRILLPQPDTVLLRHHYRATEGCDLVLVILPAAPDDSLKDEPPDL
ncbi:hypothetical protein POX_h09429 [Penicillium oxalicum]|uniref:hypothetical protein n=1 Tax=Penicillium oxalicum TaxID=69781 RepID=UPI0020B740E9|nr:hypothetical protein POX_h09429 [Penicillium oxalicum]KAI2785671.1 hypothetical protein POX_h09429 [Penicillium oxalicum]